MKFISKYNNILINFKLVLAMITLSSGACTPSQVIKSRYVTYNFRDQGFLDRDTLQVAGESAYPKAEAGSEELRRICLEEAFRNARRKAMSVFMHVYFSIPPAAAGIRNEFESDYPFRFTETDYIKAEIDFGPLLQKGFIVVTDMSSPDVCYILYRIEEPDISGKIRKMPVTFRPKNYHEEKNGGYEDKYKKNQ